MTTMTTMMIMQMIVRLEESIGTKWEGEQYLLGTTCKPRTADRSDAGSPGLS